MPRRQDEWTDPLSVRRVRLGPDAPAERDTWPATIPAVAQVLEQGLDLARLTILVGENGSGKSTLIEAIENQIESENPPAAKATFNKLTLVGYEREEILQLMAHVLAVEIDALLEEDRAFNTEWYETALRALPELPPEKQ